MKVDKRKLKIFKDINHQLNSIAAVFSNKLFDYGYGRTTNYSKSVHDDNTFEISFSIHGWKEKYPGDYKVQFTYFLRISIEMMNDWELLNNFMNEEIYKINDRIRFDEH